MRFLVMALISMGAVFAAPVPAQAAGRDAYYMIVFGQQDGLNRPRNSHTWAVFVRGDAPGYGRQIYDVTTISWMPADLQLTLLQRPEYGVNLDMRQSLALGPSEGAQIQYGPVYEISPALYQAALTRYAFLESAERSGDVLYTVLDANTRGPALYNRRGGAVNCIHALSDIGGYLDTGTLRGYDASWTVQAHLSRWAIDLQIDHSWVARALGL